MLRQEDVEVHSVAHGGVAAGGDGIRLEEDRANGPIHTSPGHRPGLAGINWFLRAESPFHRAGRGVMGRAFSPWL